MALAKFRKIYGKDGSGRFVVSEGVAPSTYMLPHPGLPTWFTDLEDDRYEIVIPQGTILSVVTDSNGDSRVVPANGTSASQAWDDNNTVNPDTGATPGIVTGGGDSFTVAARSVPIGCAQYNLYRPFDKGTSQGAGWITFGFVEWPLVQGLNANLQPGDYVRADALGRPVKMDLATDPHYVRVAKVIEVERFSTNFDDGLLSYMVLPSDPGALKTVFELTHAGPYQGKLGIRANLDVAGSVGAFRAVLTP